MPQQATQSNNSAPPLPPGYQLDAPTPAPPSGYQLDSPQAQQPEQAGYLQRLGEAVGAPTSVDQLKQLAPTWKDLLPWGRYQPLGAAKNLVSNYVQTTGSGFKKALNDSAEAWQSIHEGAPVGPQLGKIAASGTVASINALPFIGPAMNQAGQDIVDKNYKGAAGGLTGIAGQVALPFLAKRGGAALSKALPSAERAGAALQDVKSTAGSISIDMTGPGKTALELYTQAQRGGTLPKVVRDFLNRTTKPESMPLTYTEAKDFQSNISRLSADEYGKMNPNTKRLVGQLNQDLKGSLQNAADTVGKGTQFSNAMKEYHNAMNLKGWSDTVKANAWKAALTGAGLYGAKKFFGIPIPGESQ